MTGDKLIVLYDGLCPPCRASAARIRKLDPQGDRVTLADSRARTDLIDRFGLVPADVRRSLHAVTPEGRVLKGMDAVRAALRAVNKGWVLGWTKLPIAKQISDVCYRLFAKHRFRLFKIPEPEET